MERSTKYVLGGLAAVVGLYALFGPSTWFSSASSPASPNAPPGPPGAPRRFVGDAAILGDTVHVDPGALSNLFQVPVGTVAVVMGVSAAGPDNLTGPVLGVATSTGQLPIPTTGPFTVPRASVVSIIRNGAQVA